LQSAKIPLQLVGGHASGTTSFDLVSQAAQCLALFAIRRATERLSRLPLFIPQLLVRRSGCRGGLLQRPRELLLGRVGQLVGLIAQTLELIACCSEVALLNRVGRLLSG